MSDAVNHPSHYTQYEGLEIIDLTEQMNFNRGNVVKYVARAGFKDPGSELEDLKKARWYLDREITRMSKSISLRKVVPLSMVELHADPGESSGPKWRR